LTPDNLTRIEVLRNGKVRYTLECDADGAWSLPGKWPVRTVEVNQLVKTLTQQRSRFASLSGDNPFAKNDDVLTVKLTLKDKKEHTLRLVEEAGEENRFNRATFVQVDGKEDILRLGPNVIAELDRPQEYFQQRRLFDAKAVARDGDPKDKVEEVQADQVAVIGPDGAFTIDKKGAGWELKQPVVDRLDMDKVRALLTAIPDLWAERFIDPGMKELKDFGLEKPEYKISVTRPGGGTLTLLVGAISDTRTRVVQKPPMPSQFGMPPKPQVDIVQETFRYARIDDPRAGKVEGVGQIFEIKADKLKDIAASYRDLRDPRLARFKDSDVRRLVINSGDTAIVLAKEKDKDQWRMEKPQAEAVETKPVTDLVDKLAELRASGEKEVIDQADLKTLGLEKPFATIEVTWEEAKKDKDGKDDKEAKDKVEKKAVFKLGAKDKEKDKLYVLVDAWPRVNVISGEDLLKLVKRPVYAYRSRKMLDLAEKDVDKIEIQRGADSVVLVRGAETKTKEPAGPAKAWHLGSPTGPEVEDAKVDPLLRDLTKLEAVEVLGDQPKAEDLDKVYGLTKPSVTAKLSFQDVKKPVVTFLLGKQRPDKQEWYARVDSGPVFVVKKDLRDTLDKESLAYRSLQLWKLAEGDIQEIQAPAKEGPAFTLQRDGAKWKITGPFTAEAKTELAQELALDLANPRAERFEAATPDAKDLETKYGLGKAAQTLTLKTKSGDKVLLLGKEIAGDAKKKEKDRYAQLQGSPAVFVVEGRLAADAQRGALDYLDKQLLALPNVDWLRSAGRAAFKLEKNKDGAWQIVDSPAPAFPAEEDAVQTALKPWSLLRADKFAAYGPKIDWANFGLDKPGATITVQTATGVDKDKKVVEHTLTLGKDAGDGKRYARLDKQDAVIVLDAAMAKALDRTHLDYLDARVLKFDADAVNTILRAMPGSDLELAKQDDSWRLLKPQARAADDLTVGDLLEKTFRLRGERVAAYPVKDLAPFGLDKPAAVVTLKLVDPTGAATEHVIKVGNPAVEPGQKDSGQRYALVNKGDRVVVLSAALSKHLIAPALHFADRNLASFASVDQAVLERDNRRAVFSKDNVWKMTAPVADEAEDAALDDLLRDLRRLRADELVAEKGADLKQFGLEKPEAQWRFRLGEREVLHLLVGKQEAGKEKDGRRYAKLGNSDTVFLLNPKTSARVVDEFRNRKAWTGVDAAQVEKLTVTTGTTTYTLKKSGEDWVLVERPEDKIDTKLVTDTLDALASLKAQRFVADDKANLQLYGLEPPVWKLELKTMSAGKTLLVGRAEGDSQRHYATVAGTGSVFILGEEEARRILRPSSAFVQKK
jgi:hypothetical protein